MNKKRPIPEVVDELKALWYWSLYSSPTSGMGLFLFIHNFCHSSLFIHPQPLEYVSFYSSTTSGI
jgi:hypothetical protein